MTMSLSELKSQGEKLLGNNLLGGDSVEAAAFSSSVKKHFGKTKCKTHLFIVNGT